MALNPNSPSIMQGPLDVLLREGSRVSVNPPSAWPDPSMYAVNFGNQYDCVNNPIYSYQTYPAAGAAQLTFFQSTAGSAGVTYEDTNMTAAGQIAAPQRFLATGVSIDYLPGPTGVTAPVFFGAQGATGALNDFYTIFRRGYLLVTVGTKPILTLGPLINFPMRAHMGGVAAASDGGANAAVNQQLRFNIAYAEGQPFIPIPFQLQASQNFSVQLVWPGGAIPTPSTDAAARIGVVLGGLQYRPIQ